jgi:phosphinothricin acetyltransferase
VRRILAEEQGARHGGTRALHLCRGAAVDTSVTAGGIFEVRDGGGAVVTRWRPGELRYPVGVTSPSLVRPAVADDLPALTAIYNHYIVNTTITFDTRPFEPGERRAWFDDHAASGRHRLLVAAGADGAVLGYTTTSRWRPKAAYDTTVESSVYCHPDAVGRGIGTQLYAALFEAIGAEDVHQVVAGIGQPNAASVALHERFGFRPVGVFSQVGRKFGQYWDVAWYQRRMGAP